MAFSCSPFSQKGSNIDVWQCPKYALETIVLDINNPWSLHQRQNRWRILLIIFILIILTIIKLSLSWINISFSRGQRNLRCLFLSCLYIKLSADVWGMEQREKIGILVMDILPTMWKIKLEKVYKDGRYLLSYP